MLALLIGFSVAACDGNAPAARQKRPAPKQADLVETLATVLADGKETTFAPGPGGKTLTLRRLDPAAAPGGDIEPKTVAIGAVARIRDGRGGWIEASRPDLEVDFQSYVSAAKAAGGHRPQLVMEIARQEPAQDALKMILECAAAAGFSEVWLTKEAAPPPRKLPVNPAKPVPPPR